MLLRFLRRVYRMVSQSSRPARRLINSWLGAGQSPSDVRPFVEALVGKVGDREDLVILDVGSRHGLEAKEFSKLFPSAKIFCFEPNPDALQELNRNLEGLENVTIVAKAVNSYDGECSFFAIDPKRTVTTHPDGNLGASSLFRASGAYNSIERYEQTEIRVQCTRLDTFLRENSIRKVDAIWMDLQGAELIALESLGPAYLRSSLVIQTELESRAIYTGQALLQDVVPYLRSHGFSMIASMGESGFSADYLFVNDAS